jgi:hypothetical protein
MGLNKNVNDLLAPSSRKVYESLMIGENPNVKAKQTPAQKMGNALKANSPTGLPSSDDIDAEIARRRRN